MAAAVARPSRRRAVMRSPRDTRLSRRRFELSQVLRLSKNDQVIAHAHHAVRRWIEFHGAAGALNPNDHDTKSLAQIRVQNAAPCERGPWLDLHLLHIEIEVIRAGGQLDKVDDGWSQRGLRQLQTADLIGR